MTEFALDFKFLGVSGDIHWKMTNVKEGILPAKAEDFGKKMASYPFIVTSNGKRRFETFKGVDLIATSETTLIATTA